MSTILWFRVHRHCFFWTYISMGVLNEDKAVEIVKGIATGCLEAKCSLIGGETAEMPGFYAENEYDLAGFVVGVADNEDLLDGSEIAVGHRIIGIGSSGLHSNGYSLVRKIFFQDLKMSVSDYVPSLAGLWERNCWNPPASMPEP